MRTYACALTGNRTCGKFRNALHEGRLGASVLAMSFDLPCGNWSCLWESNSITNYLPSIGVLAGGMILKAILGHFSSVDAESRARANIAEGKVTFTPNLDVMGPGFGMGMGMRMSF